MKCISVNIVELVKSFQTSIQYLVAKFGVDTAENGPVKVCQKLAKSWKNVRINIGIFCFIASMYSTSTYGHDDTTPYYFQQYLVVDRLYIKDVDVPVQWTKDGC